MAKVTVYRVRAYSIATDEVVTSHRMATREGAAIMGASVIEDTGVEIDDSHLLPGEQWTARNFNPRAISGFQQQVTTG